MHTRSGLCSLRCVRTSVRTRNYWPAQGYLSPSVSQYDRPGMCSCRVRQLTSAYRFELTYFINVSGSWNPHERQRIMHTSDRRALR